MKCTLFKDRGNNRHLVYVNSVFAGSRFLQFLQKSSWETVIVWTGWEMSKLGSTSKFAVIQAVSIQTLLYNGTVQDYEVLEKLRFNLFKGKCDLPALEGPHNKQTYIDNNCHFCDSSENIIPDSCKDIMKTTISSSGEPPMDDAKRVINVKLCRNIPAQ